jgi:hypothetical protein
MRCVQKNRAYRSIVTVHVWYAMGECCLSKEEVR